MLERNHTPAAPSLAERSKLPSSAGPVTKVTGSAAVAPLPCSLEPCQNAKLRGGLA